MDGVTIEHPVRSQGSATSLSPNACLTTAMGGGLSWRPHKESGIAQRYTQGRCEVLRVVLIQAKPPGSCLQRCWKWGSRVDGAQRSRG